MIYVFSYGTIKDKFSRRTHLKGVLKTHLELITEDILPYLVESSWLNDIEGVVVGLTPEELHEVDLYEGYPQMYTRKKYPIITELGLIEAWVYYVKEGQ